MGQPQTSRRKIKLLHIALLSLGLLPIGFGIYRVGLKSGLHHRIDAIRAAGEPVTFAELDAWYARPVLGGNAADYIVEAFARMRIPEGEEREGIPLLGSMQLPPRTQPLDNETRGLIDRLLAENAQALDLLHQSTSIEQGRYPVDLTQGHSTVLSHISEMSKAARVLALEATAHAGRDEAEAAVQSVICAYALARSLLREPVPISQMVRHTCDNIATDALEHVLNRVQFTEDSLKELERTLQTACDPNALARALAGERCFHHEVFRNPRAMGFSTMPGSGEPSLTGIAARRATGLLDKDWISCLDLMGEYIQAARLPAHERLHAAREIEAKLAALPPSCAITRHVMPSLVGLISIDLVDLARLGIARTAVAVERYRLAVAQPPARLVDLVPAYLDALPIDPFDGQALRYRLLEKGYILHSIGRDETDDEGKERLPGRAGREQTSYDITFIVER